MKYQNDSTNPETISIRSQTTAVEFIGGAFNLLGRSWKKQAMGMLFCLFGLIITARGQGTIYNAPITGGKYVTRMWVPDGVDVIRGVVIWGNGFGGNSVTRAEDPVWQAFARAHGFAMMGTGGYEADMFGGEGNIILNDLAWYATASNQPSIQHAPIIFTGHSNGGQMAYEFNAWNPKRVIAFSTSKGGVYSTYNVSTDARKTPGLIISGETDSDYRITTPETLFDNNRPKGALWAFAIEENTGHSVGNSYSVWMAFYDHAIRARYPAGVTPFSGPVTLTNLSESSGWLCAKPTLANGVTGPVYRYADYPGDKAKACWLMDEDVARLFKGFATYNPRIAFSMTSGVYTKGQLITISCTDATVPIVDVYDGAEKLGTLPNGGKTSMQVMRPWGGRGIVLRGLDTTGVERTSSPKWLVIEDINRAPVANAQSVTTTKNTAKAITLTGSDIELNSLTYSVVTNPTNGTLSGVAPNLVYTPNAEFLGVDTFTFKANDGTSDSNIAQVSISVTFNFAVTFNANGGTTPIPTSKTVTYGATYGTLATTSRAGYTFNGWFTAASGGTLVTSATTVTATVDHTLYAQWTSAATYTVSYNGNGNTGGTAPSNQTKTQGVALTLATNSGNLTKTGYGFAGWNTASDGSGTNYAAGASYTADAAMVLYARWNNPPTANAGSDQSVDWQNVTTVPGLAYGTVADNINTTTPNPKTEILVNVASKTEDTIAANTTEIYTGMIYDADGQISFTEHIDDKACIWIDGVLVINNDVWNTRTSTANLNLTPGWHNIEIRISNGSGGSGPATAGQTGIGYDPAGGTTWQTLVDPGNGSFLKTSVAQAGGMASLSGSGTDIENDLLAATWSMVSGPGTVSFGNSTAFNTTATLSAAGNYVLRLTVSDGYTQSTDDVTITVNAPLPASYAAWSSGGGFANALTDTSPNGDQDEDGMGNTMEFAFGTDPTVSNGGSVAVNGSANGLPTPIKGAGGVMELYFVRRKDYSTSGSASYTVQFSSDLGTFYGSAVTPTFVANSSVNSNYEVVKVAYPASLLNGQPGKFGRIKIEFVP